MFYLLDIITRIQGGILCRLVLVQNLFLDPGNNKIREEKRGRLAETNYYRREEKQQLWLHTPKLRDPL